LEAEIQAFQRVFDAQNQELQHVQQEAENEVAEHEVAVEALQAQIDQYEWMRMYLYQFLYSIYLRRAKRSTV
jgi:hypothetical protein